MNNTNAQRQAGESLKDTIQDIAGYALLAYLLETKQWDERLLVGKSAWPIVRFFDEVKDTFALKLKSYGLQDMREVGLAGVASRLTDKLARFKNLVGGSVQHELYVHTNNAQNLQLPKKEGDVGYDLVTSEDVWIQPRTWTSVCVATGVRVKVPDNCWGLIINRSSTPDKRGLIVMNGVIDGGYTGHLYAAVWNMAEDRVQIKKGERLAQLILLPALVRPVSVVLDLPETQRGQAGFGSTG